jgi:pantothenate kinase-related protein Tda10
MELGRLANIKVLANGATTCTVALRRKLVRLRGPSGAHDEFLLAATAQNLRRLAKLIPLPQPVMSS